MRDNGCLLSIVSRTRESRACTEAPGRDMELSLAVSERKWVSGCTQASFFKSPLCLSFLRRNARNRAPLHHCSHRWRNTLKDFLFLSPPPPLINPVQSTQCLVVSSNTHLALTRSLSCLPLLLLTNIFTHTVIDPLCYHYFIGVAPITLGWF